MKNGGNARAGHARRSRSLVAVVVTASFVILSFALLSGPVAAKDAVRAPAEASGGTGTVAPRSVTSPVGAGAVRLHVVGHSDSDDDQRVKLHVRDRLLVEMTAIAEEHGGWWRVPWESHVERMAAAARVTLKDYGFAYGARGLWKRETETAPGADPGTGASFTLAGARGTLVIRIILGEGAGANWWCVLFPPLCFVDSIPEMELVQRTRPAADTDLATGNRLGSFEDVGSADSHEGAAAEAVLARDQEDDALRLGLKLWATLENWRDRAGWHHWATSLFEGKAEGDVP